MFGLHGIAVRNSLKLFSKQQPKGLQAIALLFRSKAPAMLRAKREKQRFLQFAEKLGSSFYKTSSKHQINVDKLLVSLFRSNKKELIVMGIMILGVAGRYTPEKTLSALKKYLLDDRDIIREAAIHALQLTMRYQPQKVLFFLHSFILSTDRLGRRSACEILIAIRQNKWLNSNLLRVFELLHWFLKDEDLNTKRALGNILSELSRKDPEAVLKFLSLELTRGNLHTYWIAYRAMKYLVQSRKYRPRILQLLNITEYNFKGKYLR